MLSSWLTAFELKEDRIWDLQNTGGPPYTLATHENSILVGFVHDAVIFSRDSEPALLAELDIPHEWSLISIDFDSDHVVYVAGYLNSGSWLFVYDRENGNTANLTSHLTNLDPPVIRNVKLSNSQTVFVELLASPGTPNQGQRFQLVELSLETWEREILIEAFDLSTVAISSDGNSILVNIWESYRQNASLHTFEHQRLNLVPDAPFISTAVFFSQSEAIGIGIEDAYLIDLTGIEPSFLEIDFRMRIGTVLSYSEKTETMYALDTVDGSSRVVAFDVLRDVLHEQIE